jgi:hypothetical protein
MNTEVYSSIRTVRPGTDDYNKLQYSIVNQTGWDYEVLSCLIIYILTVLNDVTVWHRLSDRVGLC